MTSDLLREVVVSAVEVILRLHASSFYFEYLVEASRIFVHLCQVLQHLKPLLLFIITILSV